MVESEPKYEPEEATAKAECPHYWLIEPPRGPTSWGICKLCGAKKEFCNQLKPSGAIGFPSVSEDDTATSAQSDDLSL